VTFLIEHRDALIENHLLHHRRFVFEFCFFPLFLRLSEDKGTGKKQQGCRLLKHWDGLYCLGTPDYPQVAIQMNVEEKGQIRSQMGNALSELSPRDGGIVRAELVGRLSSWLGPERRTVATFASLRDEPCLLKLHDILPEAALCYPRVVGSGLHFHEVSDPTSLAPAAFGIREPVPERHPEVSFSEIDVFLCPGLAFAPNGVRLGRGKGFYDRALSEARADALLVGVGLALQILGKLPAEAHDVHMNFLATEEGVLPCGDG
jgi:5,10-methenyltetrahydrofolate synthetase